MPKRPLNYSLSAVTRRRVRVALPVAGACAVLLISAGAAVARTAAARAGLRPINQRALQALVRKTARELHVPGALVLLRTPQGEFTAAYGTTRLGSRIRPEPYTHFRIASITKTMTSALILQLAQEGKLRLSDPVSKYVAGVPNGSHITIAMLLEMRSGLYDYTSSPTIAPFFNSDPTKVWTPRQVLAIAFSHPANFAPGTAYEYSNTNYALLGLIIQKLDHQPLAKVMQKRLFGPLGLKQTMLPPITSNKIQKPFAHGYLYGSSSAITTGIPDPPYTPKYLAAIKAGTVRPKDYTAVNHSFATAAGAPRPPPTISPPGSGHWSPAECSTANTSACGAPAPCRPARLAWTTDSASTDSTGGPTPSTSMEARQSATTPRPRTIPRTS